MLALTHFVSLEEGKITESEFVVGCTLASISEENEDLQNMTVSAELRANAIKAVMRKGSHVTGTVLYALSNYKVPVEECMETMELLNDEATRADTLQDLVDVFPMLYLPMDPTNPAEFMEYMQPYDGYMEDEGPRAAVTKARREEEDLRNLEKKTLEKTLMDCLNAPSEEDIMAWDTETLQAHWESIAFQIGMNPAMMKFPEQEMQARFAADRAPRGDADFVALPLGQTAGQDPTHRQAGRKIPGCTEGHRDHMEKKGRRIHRRGGPAMLLGPDPNWMLLDPTEP